MKTFKDFENKGGATFCAVAYGNILVAQKELPDGTFTKKNVKVVDDDGCIFKVQKTQIRAAGGAAGLLGFLERCEKIGDFGSCYVSNIYNAIFDTVKEAKV